MLKIDLHSHTLFSSCGVHTVVEMLTAARERGISVLAITDHGPATKGTINNVFFERLHDPVPGIRLLKGMECNFTTQKGDIDMPPAFVQWADIVLCGFHQGAYTRIPTDLPPKRYVDIIHRALDKHPYIDVITHPNNKNFLPDLGALAQLAKERGIALELSNAQVNRKRVSQEITRALIEACMTAGCCVTVSTDSHAINELGDDSQIRLLMAEAGFPDELIANRDENVLHSFLKRRQEVRLKYLNRRSNLHTNE